MRKSNLEWKCIEKIKACRTLNKMGSVLLSKYQTQLASFIIQKFNDFYTNMNLEGEKRQNIILRFLFCKLT